MPLEQEHGLPGVFCHRTNASVNLWDQVNCQPVLNAWSLIPQFVEFKKNEIENENVHRYDLQSMDSAAGKQSCNMTALKCCTSNKQEARLSVIVIIIIKLVS